MEYFITLLLLALTMIPLFLAFRSAKNGNSGKKVKAALFSNIGLFFAVVIGTVVAMPVISSAASAGEAADAAVNAADGVAQGLGFIAAALATGMSCIGGGIAVAGAATSAIGAISENPQTFAKALIFVAMAEGVALYGLLVSLQIINKL